MFWYDYAICLINVALIGLASRQLIHIFQLEGYHYRGFMKWCVADGINKYYFYPFIAGAIAQTLLFLLPSLIDRMGEQFFIYSYTYRLLPLIIYAGLLTKYITDYGKIGYKKPLVYTRRIIRLYISVLVVAAAVSFISLYFFNMIFVSSILLPLIILLAALLVNPVELLVARYYFNLSRKKLLSKNLIRIGITGSYGKTSVKFILQSILSEKYKTLVTPLSYNTPMGISKCINASLTDEHEVFIAEMGAAHNGDIKKLCALVSPHHGIITSIGAQHLETFGSVENIINTKYALIEALPADGMAFFNTDNEYCAGLLDRQSVCAKKFAYGLNGESNYMTAANIETGINGSAFELICSDGEKIICTTALLGAHNIINIIGCAAIARQLGLTMDQIAKGISKIRPIEHRLQLIHGANGVHVIDDAFNSNPAGAKAALEILAQFPGKKIVITPGMVQLGKKEKEENERFGELIAQHADIAILVGAKRTEPIKNGLLSGNFDEENLYTVASLDGATAKLAQIVQPGDTVLFENDLPDNYNEK